MNIKIREINQRECDDDLIKKLVSVWEKSVRASHFFLTENDIVQIRLQVAPALRQIPHLITAVNGNEPIGFAGVCGDKLEMLFIEPSYFGRGIGYQLINFCFDKYNVRFVDVNEQNPRALSFYKRQGFFVFKRSPLDCENRPFPILCLQKK